MLFKLAVISVLFLINTAPRVQGGIAVSLCIFSGRPDPTWYVSSRESRYEKIVQLLNSAIEKGYYYRSPPPWLGYKGFIIKERGRRRVIGGSHTTALQMMLLESMPRRLLPERNRKKVKDAINRLAARARSRARASGSRAQGKRFVPPYNPAPWSANDYIERCNNCYNYANLVLTNTTAQPGAGSGDEFENCNGVEVEAAAVRDGLLRLDPQPGANDPVPGDPGGSRHLVALVVDPDRPADPARNLSRYEGDFHWYLLDDDRRWSHKPGQTEVTRRDNDNNPITDPRQASMAPYRFVSFMTSDRNAVTIMDYEMFCD